ncbi:MAG: hypothetical protein AAB318_04525 [Planctomycetota bacterium]
MAVGIRHGFQAETTGRRGQLKLPKKKSIPPLAEYAKPYLELHKGAKENTLVMKRRAVGVLVRYLGDHPLDKITPFIVEKYRIQRKGLSRH